MRWKKIRKGMIALPVVLLIVLFLTLVFYGVLKLIKLKNFITRSHIAPGFDEGVRYDSFLLDAVILDESCTHRILNINENFLYALLSDINENQKEEIRKCMKTYLDKYNNKGAMRVTYFTILYLNRDVIFSYNGEGETSISERYFIDIYTPKRVTLSVEVGYGK